jgi:hypothetical protein
MKYIKLFEEHRSDEMNLESKCMLLYSVVQKWANSYYSKPSNHSIKVLYDTDPAWKGNGMKWGGVEFWLKQIKSGETEYIYTKKLDSEYPIFIQGSFLPLSKVFYRLHIKFTSANSSKKDSETIMNVSHNGKHIVISINEQKIDEPESKHILSLKKYITEHFDATYLINGITIDEYLHDKRGLRSGKKFGF